MSRLLWGLCVLLGVAFNPCVEGVSRYSVNSVTHSSCANTDLRINRPISVDRGVQGAPCTGYVEFENLRMCNVESGFPTKAMAQRICWTLGIGLFRESGISSNSYDQIMLYDCDIYTGSGLDMPDSTATTTDIAGWEGATPVGKQCSTITPDDFCFDQCYDIDIETDGSEDENECTGNTIDQPFWAITCSDIDECLNGVLADCKGPFPDSCTKKKACGGNTTCANTIGGWECKCDYGYRAVNGNDNEDPYDEGCEDIDECKEAEDNSDYDDGEGICGYHGQCINKPGSYICVCRASVLYDSEEKKCKKPTCPALPIIPHATPTTTPPASPEEGDKVFYNCYKGYEVHGYDAVPTEMYPYYGYMSRTSFEVECSYSGHWKPYPLPICVPIKCPPPKYVLYAHISGTNWNYDEKITYTCEHGYRPKGLTYGSTNYFEKTCQEDGSWTAGTTCEDIDECHEQPGICGHTAKYCINTKGSYMCSCVPWYYKDPANDQCVDLPYGGPSHTRCEVMKSIGLCKHGICHEGEDGEAYCSCNSGYEGSTCDRRVDSAAFIIAVIALVMVIIVICLCCFCCCIRQRWGQPIHHPVGPQVEPTYGVYGARPPGLPAVRYVRKGMF